MMCFPDPKPNQHSELTLEEAITKYGSRVGLVYRLYCSKSNVSYVGETREVFKGKKLSRIKSHYAALKKGCHPCRKLQAAWDATGGASISDEILEVVAPVERKGIESTQKIRAREKYWQEKYNATDGQVESNWHYKLKALELKRLKDSGIINNAALVYFILKLKNPWCDRPLKVNPLELAVEWEIPESSVYEAIGKLREAEVICINEAEIVITWSAHSQQDEVSDNPESFQDSRMDSEIPESILENQNEFQDSRIDSEIPENRSPELGSSNGSGCPQTYSDYSNFIQTLSEGERDNFEKFVRVEWKRIKGEEIVSLERFLAREEDIKNWHDRFLNSPAGKEAKKKAITAQFNWRAEPRFDDWIWKAFNGGYLWTQEDEAEREQRYAFWEWAQDTNAYEGVCY
jgi:hypothetical protein